MCWKLERRDGFKLRQVQLKNYYEAFISDCRGIVSAGRNEKYMLEISILLTENVYSKINQYQVRF